MASKVLWWGNVSMLRFYVVILLHYLYYKASRVASARLKPFAYDCFRQVRVQTKKPEVRIAGAKPLWS